ncbi:hypothetical protein [Micromonospora carbonacea]|uniref:hypothetical protein n=1 Tax=Micromonospora carbonacea TaxID=47853 RepID=UPI003720C3D5
MTMTATDVRTWTLLIPAPVALWSANDSHRHGPRASSANRAAWRKAGYEAAQLHRLPRNLARIRLGFVFHFQTNHHRDALNYADTAKPVIDAFGPPFVQAPTAKKPKGAAAPGWTLIPNDTPEFLESTSLAIGPLWRDVIAGVDLLTARRLDSKYGGLTVTITDLSAVRRG